MKRSDMYQMILIDNEWTISPTLLSHNCDGSDEINVKWGHTSRFESPLVCHGCGAKAPKKVELGFRIILDLTGYSPDELNPPFTVSKGAPGAFERYTANSAGGRSES